jgi:hypothetical protein
VFPANVTTPFESILNGPAETGVTFVLVGLTKTVFKVSLSVTLNTTFGFTPVFTATGLSSTASIGFKTTTVAVAFVQFTGSAPASHN